MKLLVVAVALLATVSGQTPPAHMECHCGVFISVQDGEIEIHRMKPIHLESCDDVEECTAGCSEEWANGAGGGDLDAELANGQTLGHELCHGANELHHSEVHHAIPMVYSRTCDGGWTQTGDQASDYLCCHQGKQVDCDHHPTKPPM
ncbi:unnamed protein product [Meganyctiphanes norvegica]|uniref:Uncharacterized protein n=1 Tax=Meganyctiphanes norvegica TaxID=48144 RepID=A0AAV2Q552_MEGNR